MNSDTNAGTGYRQDSIHIIEMVLQQHAGDHLAGNADICRGLAEGLERGVFNRAIDLEESNNIVASWIMPTFIPTYKMTRQLLCEKLEHLCAQGIFAEFLHIPDRWCQLAEIPIYKLLPGAFEKQLTSIMIRKPITIKVKYCDDPCSNCGKFTVIPESQQTRSADESSTPSLYCDSCTYRETRSS